jgi:hypothetical protein
MLDRFLIGLSPQALTTQDKNRRHRYTECSFHVPSPFPSSISNDRQKTMNTDEAFLNRIKAVLS